MPALLPGVPQVLERARAEGVASALSAAVRRHGELIHLSHEGTLPAPGERPLGPEDLFDVASLTKVLCTTTLAVQAVAEGALELDAPAARWLHGFEAEGKAEVTVRHLLAHTSGLPWWRPWYAQVAADTEAGALFHPPSLRPPAGALVDACAVGRALMTAAVLHEPLEAPPGARVAYSDPGFMALGLVVERALGGRLPELFEARVARPLGLGATAFHDGLDPTGSAARRAGRVCAPTGFSEARDERLQGTVNDDNAWAFGGAAGHAGLFSCADEVAVVGQAWLDALAGRPSVVPVEAALFAARDATPGSSRSLGWDGPSGEATALGGRLGRGPRGALGHLGFTGCSLWLDLDAELVAVLLTNHVHPVGPDKGRMLALRRRFHDEVAEGAGVG